MNENKTTENTTNGVPPKNYLVHSILATLFCCLPLGIMGIINATKVERLYYAGELQAAQTASDEAKKWVKFAVIGGIAVAVIYGVLMALGVGASLMN